MNYPVDSAARKGRSYLFHWLLTAQQFEAYRPTNVLLSLYVDRVL